MLDCLTTISSVLLTAFIVAILYFGRDLLVPLALAGLIWTSLWGPVGLVLSTPLTVCLVVMGRRIPKLGFLNMILSDEEALTPAEDCYQRLLSAGDHDEMDLVTSYIKTNPLSALSDSVLVPVLILAGEDQRSDLLETGQSQAVEHRLNDILVDLDEHIGPPPSSAPAPEGDFQVCCVPAKAYRDHLAGSMLA